MKIYKFTSQYGDEYNVIIQKKHYNNNRIALILTDAQDGSPVLTASVNLPDEPCLSDHTFIKNWSENTGVYKFLIDNDIVESAHKAVPTGHVLANLVKVLI